MNSVETVYRAIMNGCAACVHCLIHRRYSWQYCVAVCLVYKTPRAIPMNDDDVTRNSIISVYLDFKDHKINNITSHHSFKGILAISEDTLFQLGGSMIRVT